MSIEAQILETARNIAVVGLSPDPDRPSNHVASYLMQVGYRIIPVNPHYKDILGLVCYPNLTAIPIPIDVVDIFRRSEEVPAIVDDAIKIKAKAVWLQEGVVNDEAAERARKAGLKVVMDHCMAKEHFMLRRGMLND